MGLRPSEEVEREGLDINEHGERAYNYEVYQAWRGQGARSSPSSPPGPRQTMFLLRTD